MAVNKLYFEEKDKSYYMGDMKKLEYCWIEYILREIILKNKNYSPKKIVLSYIF